MAQEWPVSGAGWRRIPKARSCRGSVHPAVESLDESRLVAFGGRLALIGRYEDQIDI